MSRKTRALLATPAHWLRVLCHKGLVYMLLSRYYRNCPKQRDDLLDAGVDALLAAAIKWDECRGVRFSTYACIAIRRRMCLAYSRYVRRQQTHVPFSKLQVKDSDRILACPRDAWTPEQRAVLIDGMNFLRDKHPKLHHVLVSHFGIGCPRRTLADIGTDFGVCRERARQMEAEALRLLRRYASRIA